MWVLGTMHTHRVEQVVNPISRLTIEIPETNEAKLSLHEKV